MIWVLGALISSPWLEHHSDTIFTCFSVVSMTVAMSFPAWSMSKSSAYAKIFLCVSFLTRRLSITRFQRNGERTPPCGHPFDSFLVMVSPARERFMLLFVTIFMIQLLIFPFALVFSSAVFIALWGKLSNAPCMSMKTPITCSPLFR